MEYRIVESIDKPKTVYSVEYCHVNPYGAHSDWQPATMMGFVARFGDKKEAETYIKSLTNSFN